MKNLSRRDIVAFDVTPLEVDRRAGISHHVADLLEALVARRDRWRYALVASRRIRGSVPAGTLGQVGLRLPSRWLWLQCVAPLVIRRLGATLSHYTNSLAPVLAPRPFVITVHDMSLFLHASTQPGRSVLLVRRLMPAAIRRAAAVLVPSESTRRDVAVVTGVDPARIHVTQAGVAARYRLVTDAAELGRVRRTYNLPDDFLLAVGTIEPRKNLERLIDAFTLVRARGVHEPLVVVGQLGWKYTRLLDRVRAPDAQGAVRLIGYVADDDMPALYTLARGLVFPSLYEGFGLPILEAMACGTPVLTSNRSAMSEVAGSAAMLVDPHDVATMADAIQTLARDEPHREALREAGLARAAEFPWSRAAEATVRIYDRIAPSATASS